MSLLATVVVFLKKRLKEDYAVFSELWIPLPGLRLSQFR